MRNDFNEVQDFCIGLFWAALLFVTAIGVVWLALDLWSFV